MAAGGRRGGDMGWALRNQPAWEFLASVATPRQTLDLGILGDKARESQREWFSGPVRWPLHTEYVKNPRSSQAPWVAGPQTASSTSRAMEDLGIGIVGMAVA
jgi:hypothetical protein